MTKIRFQMRNVAEIIACITVTAMFSCSQGSKSGGIHTVKISNQEYAVQILAISKNSEENVEVRVTGYKLTGNNPSPSVKFWQVRTNNGQVLNSRPELGVYIVSNGRTVHANGYSMEDTRSGAVEDTILIKFPTTVMPSEVVFFAANDDTKKVVFNAKTKKPKN